MYFSVDKKNGPAFLKQASTKAERQQAYYDIDDDYRDYDDIDQIANEETNITISNIIPNFCRANKHACQI